MKSHKAIMRFAGLFVASAVVGFQGQLAHSQAKGVSDTVQVHVVITNEAVQDGGDTPLLTAQNVTVTQGKTRLKVTQVLPAKGENAALLLFILIDDTCDTGIGNNLSDIRISLTLSPRPRCLLWVTCPTRMFRSRRTLPQIMLSWLRRSVYLVALCHRQIVHTCL